MSKNKIELGCGLIRIGRVWGVDNKPVPSEDSARAFLEKAFELGVRFYDTAPAYGLSEKRLGDFVTSLTDKERKEIVVATKFGEHWVTETQSTIVDHSYDVLVSSIEQSYKKLGQIDILQLHKSSKDCLQSDQVNKAFDFAKSSGVRQLGASISDLETGFLAAKDTRFEYIQLPYNFERTELLPVIKEIVRNSKKIIFNRPFAMGAVSAKTDKKAEMLAAFKLILTTGASGIVLTGTASEDHLQENLQIWKVANEN